MAWVVIAQHPGCVAAAESPWGYLWHSVRRHFGLRAKADALQSTAATRAGPSCGPTRRPAVRIGLNTWLLETAPSSLDEGPPDRPLQRSQLVQRFVDLLEDAGLDPILWGAIVDRALDVMADARRSYEEHELRRDPYLLHWIGLTPRELGVLAALLIGPRRGDRHASSMLLALRRDPAARIQDVPRGSARLAILVAANDRLRGREGPDKAGSTPTRTSVAPEPAYAS